LHEEKGNDMRRSEMKQQTHQRIVEEAARQFRAEGIQPVGIAGLMKHIGLTHGGFYAHFQNKDALTAEACTEGFAQTQEVLLQAAHDAPPGAELAAIIEQYLSASHRDQSASGCVAASLSAEVARSPQEVRTAPIGSRVNGLGWCSVDREPRDRADRLVGSNVSR
jgi:TetR/AcrR family transcriptional repressor of nem operon